MYGLNEPIDYVHFVHKGVASIMTPMKDEPPVEIATIGPKGMVGVLVFLGSDRTPSRAFMQVPGRGVRMTVRTFREVVAQSPTFNRLLMRYTLGLMNQMSQNSACNRTHSVEERCARWLLMTHDRVQESSFQLTQEFIAQMLRVRRPTASIAAGILARAGFAPTCAASSRSRTARGSNPRPASATGSSPTGSTPADLSGVRASPTSSPCRRRSAASVPSP
jgi:CRP-like cAMP-binding protein